jgi:type I restriction enzyme, S subunit
MVGDTAQAALRDLLLTTKDGDWGKESPASGFVPYRVIRGTDFPSVRVGNTSAVPVRYLSESTIQRRTLRPDDILLETAGGSPSRPTGRSLLITERLLSSLDLPATCASFARFLRVDPSKAVPQYIYWHLQYLYASGQMEEHQVQHTGVARFQYTKFAETEQIPLPAPDEQRAIAHILGTLDDKIELNRRMNETLEAMARALFKSWFVDFDPVRAKSEGRDPGLPKPLADLFPDSFEDSELGEVPKGWRVLPLAECVDAARGLSYKGSGLSDSGLPMHNLNSIYEGGGYKHEGIKHYEGDYRPHHVARAGDLIVANTEQGHNRLLIGYAAIVPAGFDGENLFSHHIYRVRPRSSSGLTSHYLCHLLNTSVMHDTVSGYANGTTVNMLPIDGLQSPLVVVPPSVIVRAFDGFAEAARKRHGEMMDESSTLSTLRDTLLPKLISGELRVPHLTYIAGSHKP